MDIRVIAHGSEDYEQMKQLRQDVMRTPLGMVLSDSDIEGEAMQILIAAFEGKTMLGSVIFKPLGEGVIKLRQMAVSDASQGKGVGKQLVRFGEELALTQGYTTVDLSARVSAQVFYEKLGYTAYGEAFEDVGLPHIMMTKTL